MLAIMLEKLQLVTLASANLYYSIFGAIKTRFGGFFVGCDFGMLSTR
jgi:hypothetical protein